MTSSGSSTLSVPSLYNASASDDNESTYLKRMRILHWSQLVLALIIFSVAVSVIGCEAAPLRHYMATSAYKHVWLSLWPLNFDLRPTVGLLSCGCIIVFQSMIYVVAALLPSVSCFDCRCSSLVDSFMLHSANRNSIIRI